jgi:hypothetical protein
VSAGRPRASPRKETRTTRIETVIMDGKRLDIPVTYIRTKPLKIEVTYITPKPQRFKHAVRLVCPVSNKATDDPLIEAAGRRVCSDCLVRATALAAREGSPTGDTSTGSS